MKKTAFFLLAMMLSIALFGQTKMAMQETITANNARELLEAVKPNTKILLRPGVYNLSEALDQVFTPYLSTEEVYDGIQGTFSNISNLTIIGKPGTEIVVQPRYSWVLRFVNSSNIQMKNIVAGHVEEGYCIGGVVSFANSSNILLEDMVLYGSGTEGLGLEGVTDFSFENSVIKECTYDLMTMSDSKRIKFNNSSFLNTGEFGLIILDNSHNVSFNGCTFRDNLTSGYSPYFFQLDERSSTLTLQYCLFMDNKVGQFANRVDPITLIDNEFLNNQFGNPR